MPDSPITFTETEASEFKEARMKQAIVSLANRGIYPSAAKISKAMGRNTRTLNGPECVMRRRLFKELGIKLKRSGWVDKYTAFLEEYRGPY